MEASRTAVDATKNPEVIQRLSVKKSHFPVWLFQHNNLIHTVESAKVINRDAIINTINRIHFLDDVLYAHLQHPKYEENLLVRAHPEPCLNENLTCRWSSKDTSGLNLDECRFLHLIIEDGNSIILTPCQLESLDKNHFKVKLPETAYAVFRRKTMRYPCEGIDVKLIQNDFQAQGELIDFNPLGFRVRVTPEHSSTFHSLNPDSLVISLLQRGERIFFSGMCRLVRQGTESTNRDIVLAPDQNEINRFKKGQTRNPRQLLVPSPTVVFEHPLMKKKVQLEVYDISTLGFSVHETSDEAKLMPGLIIPELTINYAGALNMKCRAQVIHRSEEEDGVLCGLAILDMDIATYSLLNHILTHALDPYSYISNEVDMDALWDFFFETGFIYPSKYRMVQADRTKFKNTYEKLYQENPEIARHFTYQKNGKIYGHVAMVRAYSRAWLIHHHAARRMDGKRVGFLVLKQIMHYMNDVHRLASVKMDYAMCYFRPENRIPDLVFGGFARAFNNYNGCSLDLFSYLPYTTLSLGFEIPKGWSLELSTDEDVRELRRFYSYHSGGLFVDAMGLGGAAEDESISDVYAELGLLRKISIYSLKKNDDLRAVFIVEQSEQGLNLSELLNCIKIFITNTKETPWEVLSIAISKLASVYQSNRIPILFYPFEYIEQNDIPYERQYTLWTLNMQYVHKHIEFMQRKFRIGYK